jgi:hypothetical protein
MILFCPHCETEIEIFGEAPRPLPECEACGGVLEVVADFSGLRAMRRAFDAVFGPGALQSEVESAQPTYDHLIPWADIERLENERHELMNSFGEGQFRDGLVRDRITEIDRRLSRGR